MRSLGPGMLGFTARYSTIRGRVAEGPEPVVHGLAQRAGVQPYLKGIAASPLPHRLLTIPEQPGRAVAAMKARAHLGLRTPGAGRSVGCCISASRNARESDRGR